MVIICVYIDILILSSCPKKFSFIDYVQKADHFINLVLTTAVVSNNINSSHLMVLIVWLIISPLVIEPTKESRGNGVHSISSFKFSTSINQTDVIQSIMNIQAINIGRLQVIGMSRMFTFESCQDDILAHVHGQCSLICVGAWLLCICMNFLFLSSFLQIICLNPLIMWWKYLPIWYWVLLILHL